MNGTYITGTPIAVDFWRWKQCQTAKIFFLSHCHSDHTSGLSSTWRWPIYCSEITGKIAVAKCDVKPSLIRPLSIGDGGHIIPLDEHGKETMTVTLIDANHCPGATMFLFEGYFGRILYTGDCRYHPHMIEHSVLKFQRSIDRLYLDNTYNDTNCVFPSEDQCKAQILQIIAEYPFHNIVIGLHQLGKEDLLEDIANFVDDLIEVTPERMSMLQLLACKPVFTTAESRIKVVQQHTITWSAVERWNEEFPTIVVIPSAVFCLHRKSSVTSHPNVFLVPYSSHSSYTELTKLVALVKPKKIIPIVKPSSTQYKDVEEYRYSDVSNFDHLLDTSPTTIFTIPPTVQKYITSTCNVPLNGTENMKIALKKRPSHTSQRRFVTKRAKGVVFEEDESCSDKSTQYHDKETGEDGERAVNAQTANGSPSCDGKVDPVLMQAITDCVNNTAQDTPDKLCIVEPTSGTSSFQICTRRGVDDGDTALWQTDDGSKSVKQRTVRVKLMEACPSPVSTSSSRRTKTDASRSNCGACNHNSRKPCLCKYFVVNANATDKSHKSNAKQESDSINHLQKHAQEVGISPGRISLSVEDENSECTQSRRCDLMLSSAGTLSAGKLSPGRVSVGEFRSISVMDERNRLNRSLDSALKLFYSKASR